MIGTVTALVGNATIRFSDGTSRALKVGDEVQPGDVVITATSASLEIQPADETAFVVQENTELLINEELFGLGVSTLEAELTDETVAAVLEALASGADILDSLEAPGAGGDPGNNGHGFVRLARILFDLQERGIELGEAESQLEEFLGVADALRTQPTPAPEPEPEPEPRADRADRARA